MAKSNASSRKFNNKGFTESFNHVEPYIMTVLQLTEAFSHEEPPTYTWSFNEPFDA